MAPWGDAQAEIIVAIVTGMLQKSGGSFPLTAEVDFGTSFGVKSLYLKSRTANPASTGPVRLAKTDLVYWRNNANSADLGLGISGSDRLQFDGTDIPLVPIALSDLVALTASRAVVSDGSGFLSAATTTATEIGYVNGVTSAIQTQLDAKLARVQSNNYRLMATNGSATIAEAAAITSSRALVSDANGIPTASSVTATELGYLSGVTSGLQTQINNRITTAQTHNYRLMATDGSANIGEAAAITASRALASDSNGIPAASATTATELGYVSGVTSAIQSQIDGKVTTPTEQTFSPTVTATGSTVPQYSTNTGRYMIVGSTCFVDVYLTGDGGNEGSGGGQLKIAMPVASNANHPDGYFFCGTMINGTTNYILVAKITGGATVLPLSAFASISLIGAVTAGDQSNTSRSIRLKYFYEI